MLISKYSLFLCSLALSSVFLCLAKYDVSENQRRPEYEQCVRQCQEQQPGRPEVCRQICRDRQGVSGREPQRREECERRCSWDTRSQREQQECPQQCRGQESRPSEEVGEDELNQRRRFQECSQRCERQERGKQQQDCRKRCQKEFEREQEREHGRGRGGRDEAGEDELNQQDPRRRFQECSQLCERQERGQQQDCRRRCQKEFEPEQEREHGRGRGRSEEAGEDELNQQDPRRRFQECSQRCERQERGQQQQDCRRRCQNKFEREQERQEREHGRGKGDDNQRDTRRRYHECQVQCRRQQGRSQQECQRRCQDEFRRESESEGRRGRGDDNKEDPRRRFQECREQCQKQGQGRSQQQCQRRCQQEFERERQESEHGRGSTGRNEGQVSETGEEQDSPYLFKSGHFQESFRSSEGSLRFLPKFNVRSPLLRGIKHFRFAEVQAGPNTVYLPHHSDSDCVYVVTRGRGTITFVNHERKESFNIEQGNVIRVPAGNTLYLVNRESNERLNVALFVNPVNTPGEFEDFYPAGSENPRSYYRAFSTEILEQALNTRREEIERLFQGREGQGIIRRASQEQVQAMSRHASSPRSKGRDIRSPIDLTNQKPVYSNQNGRFFEANPREFRQLEDIDVSVGVVELKQDAMFAPHYNSRTTYVVYVGEGEGQVEMACPHLSRGRAEGEEEERSGEIQRVSFRVSAGDVFIIPAGHPITMLASGNQNLTAVGFGVNARNNERVFLAGRENLMRQMDSEAKEVAFGVPVKLVDQIFNNPKESYFLSKKGQQQQQGRDSGDKAGPLSSIVEEVARLF